MLAALSIRIVLVVADLEFGEGLSVLTGRPVPASRSCSTPSPCHRRKSDAASCGRAHSAVTAIFTARHPVCGSSPTTAWRLKTLICGIQSADGARLHQRRARCAALRQVGHFRRNHGQHDDRALIDPSGHRDLVDAFGGLSTEADAVASAWEAWRGAEDERARHAGEIASIRANADYVSHALDELVRLNPQTGGGGACLQRQLMMHAEKIAAELNEALDALQGEGQVVRGLPLRSAGSSGRRGQGALLASVAEALERVLAEPTPHAPRSRRRWPRRPSSRMSSSAPKSGYSRSARLPTSTGSRWTICRPSSLASKPGLRRSSRARPGSTR
jgi:DNA repair protein RecN (Recombination protein N)